MKTACIIPVRGGSKGIPRKNLMPLANGVSLLAWTIAQALRCFNHDEVIVSTEDAEMAKAAKESGAQVVHRSPELARDHSTTVDVVTDLLGRIDREGDKFDTIAILQVTSPLRHDDDVSKGKALMGGGRFDSVVSGFELAGIHPAKMYYLDGDLAVSVCPEHETARRQDLPPVFRRNGAIFMCSRNWFDTTRTLWGGRTGLVLMPAERSVDIDKPEDLELVVRTLQAESRL